MFDNLAKKRKNMAQCSEESFKPLLHSIHPGILGKITHFLRRFADLQFGSIWRDLAMTLPHVRGLVLDIGCGAQPFRRLFDDRHVKYTGIDTIDSKPNFGYHNPDTLYYSGKKLPVENTCADFILCTETLEHILEPEWLLNEMWRALKPGGNTLITIPFAARWHFIPFDYWRYTPSSLLHLLESAGFSNVRIYARGNPLTVACYKIVSLMFPFLVSPAKTRMKLFFSRLTGIVLLPCLFMVTLMANMTVNCKTSAEDCLGFTVIAEKKT